MSSSRRSGALPDLIGRRPVMMAGIGGWFRFAFTGGLTTPGCLLARISIPVTGAYASLWPAPVTVFVGGVVAPLGIPDDRGAEHRAEPDENPTGTLFASLVIVRRSSAEFDFPVMLPTDCTRTLHSIAGHRLAVTACVFTSDMVGNLLSGTVSDRLTWRRTIMFIGAAFLTACTDARARSGATPAATSMPDLECGRQHPDRSGSRGLSGVMRICSATWPLGNVLANSLTLNSQVEAEVAADRRMVAGR